jgi:hypothetical protein
MDRDALLTYGAPFLGAILLSAGILGAVVGGYAAVQASAGLCGDPLIEVSSPEDTQDLLDGYERGGPTLQRVDYENLSAAEQAAFEEALPDGEGAVDGEFPNREAIAAGVVVEYEGEGYYTTLHSDNTCTAASPLLFPLGIVSMVLGVVGVATPPLYRRYLRFEREQRRD